jgi:type IV pilus assembly protein PilQ
MMKRILRRSLAVVVALAVVFPQGLAVQAWADDTTVTVDGLSIGNDTVTIKLSAATQYNDFLTSDPPRLVVELFDAQDEVGAKELPGQGRFLKRVRVSQFQSSPRMISRVVMDLKATAGYRLAQAGNSLVVQLVDESGAEPAAAPSAAPATDQDSPADQPPAESAAKPSIVPKAQGAAGVLAVPASATETSAELSAMASEGAPAPAPAKAEPRPEPGPRASHAGTRISAGGDIMARLPKDLVTLDFDETELRDVLKLMAAKAKINIIYGNDVSGSTPVTLHLNDVPFNEAMQTLLSMAGLVTTQVGDNILRILTVTELSKQRTQATNITKVIPLNYSKAGDILPSLAAVRTAEGRTGSATADAKTNSLILTESPDGMATEERLIAQLDVKPKQVLIEAKLIELTLSNSLDLGIQWNYLSNDTAKIGNQVGSNLIGTLANPAASASPIATPLNQNANFAPVNPGSLSQGTGVNLPANNVLGALTLGRITNNFYLAATLTAAATAGKVKVLSDPKIATLNNQPANINVTTQYPYLTSSVATTAGGAISSNVQYVSVGIQLSVTPTINADGRIMLNINPNVTQPSATAPTNAASGAPGIDQRQAQTTVLVKDGETIVIGGLITDSVTDTIAKIPLLGDIPILGWLFKSKHKQHTRSELLIFVTPKILAD